MLNATPKSAKFYGMEMLKDKKQVIEEYQKGLQLTWPTCKVAYDVFHSLGAGWLNRLRSCLWW